MGGTVNPFVITDRQIGQLRATVTVEDSVVVCELTPLFDGTCVVFAGYGFSSWIAALKYFEPFTYPSN